MAKKTSSSKASKKTAAKKVAEPVVEPVVETAVVENTQARKLLMKTTMIRNLPLF